MDSITFPTVETISDRIAEILREMDGPERGRQTRLAEIAGFSKALVGQLLDNPSRKLGHEYAKRIEERMGWRADWLLYGKLPKKVDEDASRRVGVDGDEIIELVLLYRQSTKDARARILQYARSADKASGALRIVFPADNL